MESLEGSNALAYCSRSYPMPPERFLTSVPLLNLFPYNAVLMEKTDRSLKRYFQLKKEFFWKYVFLDNNSTSKLEKVPANTKGYSRLYPVVNWL
jgi:hypothetical protein